MSEKNSAEYWDKNYQRCKDEDIMWTWDRQHNWKRILPIILDNSTTTNSSLLDLGCGIGAFTKHIADKTKENPFYSPFTKLVGIDRSGWAINYANEHKGSLEEYKVGEVDATGFDKNSFDVVTAHEILEHVPDPDVTLKAVVRVLNCTGILVVTTPHDGCLGGEDEHCSEFTHDSLYHLLIKYFRSVTFYENIDWYPNDIDGILVSMVAVGKGVRS